MKKHTISIFLIIIVLLSGYNLYFKENKVESINNQMSATTQQKKKVVVKEQIQPTINNRIKSKPNNNLNQQSIPKPNNKSQENSKLFNQNKDIETTKHKITKPTKEPSLVDKIHEHTVQYGENLFSIAKKYNINIDTILGANDITNMNRIKQRMKIKILTVKGILYKINPGDSLWELTQRFDISLDRITKANNIRDPGQVQLGDLIILPGAKPEFGYQDRLKKQFIAPIHTPISSYFGYRVHPISGKRTLHEGIDYAVNVGTTVRAARGGKIVYSGWARGYGKTVIIEHQRGLRTLYAHNSKLLVYSGENVYRGEPIAKSGNTGRSTGPHLHFEIQVNSRPVNPLNYLK